MQDLNFKYDLYPVIQPLDSMNNEIWEVRFAIFPVNDSEEPVLEGRLDWQDGISIYQTECLEYEDFIPIMMVASMAIAECKKHIGKERWELGGQVWESTDE